MRAWAFLLSSLLGVGPATASVVRPHTVESLTERSSRVIRGRVVQQYSAWDEAHRRIHTWTELEVLASWLPGDADRSEDALRVHTLGGVVGDLGMRVSGTPTFEVGAEVVVFLQPSAVDAEAFDVVGMSQGKFDVVDGWAEPSVHGLAFVDPKDARPAAALPRLRVESLRERVRAAAEAAAPGSGSTTEEAPDPEPRPADPRDPGVPSAPTFPEPRAPRGPAAPVESDRSNP